MTKETMPLLLITPSLLNSWLYLFQSQEDNRDEFLQVLNREQTATNKYMQAGIDYEEETYKGNTEASPYVENGEFQLAKSKRVIVDGINFLMYGRLDCLKGGTIYDIKCTSHYERPKYFTSAQHRFYLDLIPSAKQFTYLIWNENLQHLFLETYTREETISTETRIHQFLQFLKANNFTDIYLSKWKAR